MSSFILRSAVSNSVLRLKVLNVLYAKKINFSTKPYSQILSENEGDNKKRKKTDPIPKITLLSSEDNMTVTTLQEAEKISKRRDLKLVKILDLDSKTQRPVYKLMTPAEYYEEELKEKESKKKKTSGALKGEKLLFLSSGISEHDLNVHAKKILKWIEKRYEVKVVINGNQNDTKQAENVYKYLEGQLGKSARFLQKRKKGSDVKFQILPLKEDKNVSAEE